MPAPDPFGIEYDETDEGRPAVMASVWPSDGLFGQGNRRNRLARARSVLRKLIWNGWACRQCGDPVPLYKRADAVFCSSGCKKRAKRTRQQQLTAKGGGQMSDAFNFRTDGTRADS